MISSSEIAALNRALASYEAFAARLRATAESLNPVYAFTEFNRMWNIVEAADANVARFYSRRDELVEQDPTDHEAIAAFVSGIADATSTKLVQAMAAEVKATDPVNFVKAIADDSWNDLKTFIIAGIFILGGFLYFTRR